MIKHYTYIFGKYQINLHSLQNTQENSPKGRFLLVSKAHTNIFYNFRHARTYIVYLCFNMNIFVYVVDVLIYHAYCIGLIVLSELLLFV